MKRSIEGDDYRKLQKLGFELNSPSDAFAAQPDSGSAIGGERGRDEYGIEDNLASGDKLLEGELSILDVDSFASSVTEGNDPVLSDNGPRPTSASADVDTPMVSEGSGTSEYSATISRGASEDMVGGMESQFDLHTEKVERHENFTVQHPAGSLEGHSLEVFLGKRLTEAPALKGLPIKASVNNNIIYLNGIANTFAQKELAREIAEAVAENQAVEDRIIVNG